MKKHDPTLILRRMQDAANLIITYVEGQDIQEFSRDIKTQNAVFMNFILLGELARRAECDYPDLVASNHEMPWAYMKAMRNQVAHNYYALDLEITWDTIKNSLPQLLILLDAAIKRQPTNT